MIPFQDIMQVHCSLSTNFSRFFAAWGQIFITTFLKLELQQSLLGRSIHLEGVEQGLARTSFQQLEFKPAVSCVQNHINAIDVFDFSI